MAADGEGDEDTVRLLLLMRLSPFAHLVEELVQATLGELRKDPECPVSFTQNFCKR